jgi:dipeptidyl aminopeptidase/acylaminoacyl peptidase
MNKKVLFSLLVAGAAFAGCQNATVKANAETAAETDVDSSATAKDLNYPGEKHLANIKQLTDGGDNAEAYFSFNNKMAVFQSNYQDWDVACDQIFYFDLEGDDLIENKPKMVSTGLGRTTCSYFMPGDSTIIYASTHLGDSVCPPEPSKDEGYVWPVYPNFDIFVADLNGNILDTLTSAPGYDAEPTVSPKGDRIVFTSTRSGDLELWTMKLDGSDKKQITKGLGYDGGAFFSPDGSQLVFRASRPKTEEEVTVYQTLLDKDLVMPSNMELYVCNADGSNLKQVTRLGNANWAPFFHPSGKKIIFSSNHNSQRGFPFNLFMINVDGSGLEQITFDEQFDAFPMFSPDGKKLIFSSNRNNGGTRNTNLFIADWVE